MSGQLSYSYQTPKGVPGSLLDISPYSIDSRVNGETDPAKMKYGMGAVIGANPGTDILVPTATSVAENFEGVILTGFTNQMNMSGDVSIFPLQTVGILRWGRAWVRVASGVSPNYGDQLYLIITGTNTGMFTNNAGAGIEVPGTFIGGLGTGDIAPAVIYNQKSATPPEPVLP